MPPENGNREVDKRCIEGVGVTGYSSLNIRFVIIVLVPRTRPRVSEISRVRTEIFSRTMDEYEDEDDFEYGIHYPLLKTCFYE